MSTSNPDQITVTHGNYSVTVQAATIGSGFRRTRLNAEMRATITDEMSMDEQFLRVVLYPDLIASAVKADGFEKWPISFDEFVSLPEKFGIKWEEATYSLNKAWLSSDEPDDEEKKSEGQNRTEPSES